MNGLVILGFAAAVLLFGYLFYGRWLAKSWGVDSKAETPAVKYNDGKDFVPSSRLTVFAHQFSSIAGAGPVQGPILAAAFGWVPVLLWLLVGGVFFGAVQDFGAMYASVKNDGKSIGMVIEKYIGKTGRRCFSLFCWLFTLLVIAAFTSMVSSTFNGFAADGTRNFNGAAAATISMLFVVVAIGFGFWQRKFRPKHEWQNVAVALLLLVVMFAVGMKLPVYLTAGQWNYVIMVYLFMASVMPMWMLMEPRDYLTTFMLLGMIIGAVLGVVLARPDMQLNAFNGFVLTNADTGAKSLMFPTLFVTIACGAVSGFHSLVSSGTSSKTVRNEKDMLFCSYGAMLVETLLGVLALVVVGAVSKGGFAPAGLTPFQIFSSGVAGFLESMGVPNSVAAVFMTMCISALALTSLDSVARIGKMSFQELFASDEKDPAKVPSWQKLCTNPYFATVVTLSLGYLLALGGYQKVWALFGAANQMLAALVLTGVAIFLKATNRRSAMLYVPMAVMLCVTFTAILMNAWGNVQAFLNGTGVFLVNGLQLIIGVGLLALGVKVAFTCIRRLLEVKRGQLAVDEEEKAVLPADSAAER